MQLTMRWIFATVAAANLLTADVPVQDFAIGVLCAGARDDHKAGHFHSAAENNDVPSQSGIAYPLESGVGLARANKWLGRALKVNPAPAAIRDRTAECLPGDEIKETRSLAAATRNRVRARRP